MSKKEKGPELFDTETWLTVRLEGGEVSARAHVRGVVHDQTTRVKTAGRGAKAKTFTETVNEPRYVTRHFPVNIPKETQDALKKLLTDRESQLKAAGTIAAMEARKIAVNRREIEEVMQ